MYSDNAFIVATSVWLSMGNLNACSKKVFMFSIALPPPVNMIFVGAYCSMYFFDYE